MDETRLTEAADRAYAAATGHDAGTPYEKVQEAVKQAIREALEK